MRSCISLALALALCACGKADNEPGPGGVTVGEARALDEAAEMIEAQRPPEDLLRSGEVTATASAAPAAAPASQPSAAPAAKP